MSLHPWNGGASRGIGAHIGAALGSIDRPAPKRGKLAGLRHGLPAVSGKHATGDWKIGEIRDRVLTMAENEVRENRERDARKMTVPCIARGKQGSLVRGARVLTLCAGLGVLLAVTACSPRVDVRGNVADQEDMIRIRQGITTKQEVQQVLGSPSTVSAFDKKTWYYVSKREESLAFFKPTTKNQNVIELRFDEEDVVQRIRKYSLADARNVSRVSRTTKADGSEPGVFKSFIDMIVRRGSVVRNTKKTFGL